MARKMKISPEKYVKDGGGRCPLCGNPSIQGDAIDIEGNCATQEVWCSECDFVWTDQFTLTGYVYHEEDLPIEPN